MADNCGGRRPGAGRKRGGRNKKTIEQMEAVFLKGLTPLEYLLSVVRDPTKPEERRIEAAGKAAPYVHARLNVTQLDLNDSRLLSADERRARVLELLRSNQITRFIGGGDQGVEDAEVVDLLPGPGAAAS